MLSPQVLCHLASVSLESGLSLLFLVFVDVVHITGVLAQIVEELFVMLFVDTRVSLFEFNLLLLLLPDSFVPH